MFWVLVNNGTKSLAVSGFRRAWEPVVITPGSHRLDSLPLPSIYAREEPVTLRVTTPTPAVGPQARANQIQPSE